MVVTVSIGSRFPIILILKLVLFFTIGWFISFILHISLWATFDFIRFERYFNESLSNGTLLDGLFFQLKASLLLGGGLVAALFGMIIFILNSKEKR